MPNLTAERVDAQVFEPVFANIEPERYGNLLLRSICSTIDRLRAVRVGRIDNIMKIDLSTREIKETKLGGYIVDMAQRQGKNWYVFSQATWQDQQGDGQLELSNGRYRSGAYDLTELGKHDTAEELFEAYDRQRRRMYSDSPPAGWSAPDIYTAKGVTELAAMLHSSTEASPEMKEGE